MKTPKILTFSITAVAVIMLSATIAIAAPAAVIGLTATSTTATSTILSWAASSTDTVSGYKILKNADQIATASSSTTSFLVGSLTPNTSYVFGVTAYDSSNATSSLATTSVTTLADTAAPSVPTNLATTAINTNQINLTWTNSTDNIGVMGYKIYRDGPQVGTSSINSFNNIGLSASTTYLYSVAAYDAANNVSATSSSLSATTLATGSTPIATTTPRIRVIGNGQDGRLINLRSNAKIKVIVFGGSSFNVKDIDRKTVTFAGAPAVNHWRQRHNRDRFMDRVFEFRARDMKDLINLASTTASAEVSFKAVAAGVQIEIKTTVRVKNLQKWHEDRDREQEREEAREALKKERERLREAAKDALEKQRELLKQEREKNREAVKEIKNNLKSNIKDLKNEIKDIKNDKKDNKEGKRGDKDD
ncbi:MAG: fibronectin type III domain-containing protein [Patescibacteria group bacterium]